MKVLKVAMRAEERCRACGEEMHVHNMEDYGADRDGRRGRLLIWFACPECGEEQARFADEICGSGGGCLH